MSSSKVQDDLLTELARDLDYSALLALRTQIYSDPERLEHARVTYGEASEAQRIEALRLGWLLNQHRQVLQAKPGNNSLDVFLQAKSMLACGEAAAAQAAFESLGTAYPPFVTLGVAEALIDLGEFAAALVKLDALLPEQDRVAELHYLRGLALDRAGDYRGAEEAYQTAVARDATFAPALFRLAYNEDLRGDSDRALELYQRCVELRPTYVNALLNLGVLYDDRGEFALAIACFSQVLETCPNNERARLFYKDSLSSLNMHFDEDQARRTDRQNLILSIPVTDFELSVRSRNCLTKMNIRTLGDLVEKTEAELLSYKNFGETSLMEIKEILAKKQLRLGMGRDGVGYGREGAGVVEQLLGMTEEVVSPHVAKPLSEIEFSVRVRTTIGALNLHSLGDLAARTSRELLSCKNFGQTSLEEVRQVLHKHNMSLADEPSAS